MGFLSNILKNIEINKEYDPHANKYKMETMEQIESIPVPEKQFTLDCGIESIEYVLQRKATEFKESGRMDLAIACLKKSNEIMPFAPKEYSDADYIRLEQYLKKERRFDEARIAESNRMKIMSNQKRRLMDSRINDIEKCDYIIVQRCDEYSPVCEECAKYHDRIYSYLGEKGFPDINIYVEYIKSKRCDCSLWEFPYFYGCDDAKLSKKDKLKHSNREFKDDRSAKEKELYKLWHKKKVDDINERFDYDWLCEFLPEKAPKSLSGYKNMKHRNSENYKKLKEEAKKMGHILK